MLDLNLLYENIIPDNGEIKITNKQIICRVINIKNGGFNAQYLKKTLRKFKYLISRKNLFLELHVYLYA